MKTWFHKIVLPAGCTVAAGVLSLASPATAQVVSELPAGPIGHVAPANEITISGQSADSYGRLTELKVELAWLADPTTFPYRLAARVENSSLEVRGFVPNEAVRDLVVKVAREQGGMNVQDNLQVHTGLVLRSVGRPVAELQAAAKETLADEFPDHARGLEVQAQRNGQLSVSGSVPSFELKVAVSNALRRVRGCTHVANHLHVSTMEKDGRSFVMVSADGSLLVPEEVTEHPPAEGRAITTRIPSGAMVRPMPAQTVSLSPPKPESVKPAAPASVSKEKSHLTLPGYTPMPSTEPTVVKPPSSTSAKPGELTGYPPMPSAVKPLNSTPTKTGELSAYTPMPSVERSSAKPLSSTPAKPTELSGYTPMPSADRSALKPLNTTVAKPAEVTGKPSSNIATSVAKAPALPAPPPAVAKKPATEPAATGAYVTSGLILIDAEEDEAKPATKPAAPVKPAPARPTSVAQTAQVTPARPISLTTSTPMAPAKPAVPVAPAPAAKPPAVVQSTPTIATMAATPAKSSMPDVGRLRQQITTCCGTLAKGVEVTADSEKSLSVRVKARTEADGEKLSEKIFSMPELGPYQVSLDVQVVP